MKDVAELNIFIHTYPLSALVIPLRFIPFTIEGITGCNNEAAKGASKAGRKRPPYFLFHDLVLLIQ